MTHQRPFAPSVAPSPETAAPSRLSSPGWRLTWALCVMVMASSLALAEPVTTVRVFQLSPGVVTVAEAVNVIVPLLSEAGSLTVQPKQRRLTVQDMPNVMGDVEKAMRELTRAPDRYRIRAELLEASNSPVDKGEQAEVDERVRRMFQFSSFRRLGVTVFDGRVGEPATASLGEDHRIGFVAKSIPSPVDAPWGIRDPGSRVHLERLSLVERRRADSGGVQRQTEVLRTNMVLARGQRVIVGASGSEESDRALVLILAAEKVGGQ